MSFRLGNAGHSYHECTNEIIELILFVLCLEFSELCITDIFEMSPAVFLILDDTYCTLLQLGWKRNNLGQPMKNYN